MVWLLWGTPKNFRVLWLQTMMPFYFRVKGFLTLWTMKVDIQVAHSLGQMHTCGNLGCAWGTHTNTPGHMGYTTCTETLMETHIQHRNTRLIYWHVGAHIKTYMYIDYHLAFTWHIALSLCSNLSLSFQKVRLHLDFMLRKNSCLPPLLLSQPSSSLPLTTFYSGPGWVQGRGNLAQGDVEAPPRGHISQLQLGFPFR